MKTQCPYARYLKRFDYFLPVKQKEEKQLNGKRRSHDGSKTDYTYQPPQGQKPIHRLLMTQAAGKGGRF
jgi:hypothetical protein